MRLGRLTLPFRPLPHFVVGAGVILLLFALSAPMFVNASASAELMNTRSVKLSDGTVASTGVKYNFSFTTNTSGPIGAISFEVCSNYIYNQGDPCSAPPGFDASAATLTNSSGVTDFSLQSPTPTRLLITRSVASPVTPQPVSYEFSGITNPRTVGSYYVHIATYAATDGSGMEIDYANVVFAVNENITITTEVPPYLQFCVGVTIDGYNCGTADGGFISFGELSTQATRAATSQMLASTNAAYGYSVTLAGTTMIAGSNIIPAMTGGPSRIGISQFGLNARSNSGPAIGVDPDGPGLTMPSSGYNTSNSFKFVSGDIIASSAAPDDFRKMTVSYIVNRDAAQAPGRYVATISYICLANF